MASPHVSAPSSTSPAVPTTVTTTVPSCPGVTVFPGSALQDMVNKSVQAAVTTSVGPLMASLETRIQAALASPHQIAGPSAPSSSSLPLFPPPVSAPVPTSLGISSGPSSSGRCKHHTHTHLRLTNLTDSVASSKNGEWAYVPTHLAVLLVCNLGPP